MKKPMSHENNKWTKRVLTAAMLLCLMVSPMVTNHVCAQVFISDDEYNNNRANVSETELIPILPQNLEVDWIEPTPLGEGWLLLSSLGGIYLLKKRRKGDEQI